MATTFNWKVAQLERLCSTGEIQTVHYTVDARSEDDTYNAGAYGSMGLDPADPDNMIPFADVTEAEVISWLQAKFGEEKVEEIQTALQKQLDEQRAPSIAQGMPWAVAA